MHQHIGFCDTSIMGRVANKNLSPVSSNFQEKAASSILCSSSSSAFCRQGPQLSRLSCLIALSSRLSFFVLLQDIFSLTGSHPLPSDSPQTEGMVPWAEPYKVNSSSTGASAESTISSFKASLGGGGSTGHPPSPLPLHRLIPPSPSPDKAATTRRRHYNIRAPWRN